MNKLALFLTSWIAILGVTAPVIAQRNFDQEAEAFVQTGDINGFLRTFLQEWQRTLEATKNDAAELKRIPELLQRLIDVSSSTETSENHSGSLFTKAQAATLLCRANPSTSSLLDSERTEWRRSVALSLLQIVADLSAASDPEKVDHAKAALEDADKTVKSLPPSKHPTDWEVWSGRKADTYRDPALRNAMQQLSEAKSALLHTKNAARTSEEYPDLQRSIISFLQKLYSGSRDGASEIGQLLQETKQNGTEFEKALLGALRSK
jgi:hypothetical protein